MNLAIVGYGKMGKFYDGLLRARYIVDVFPIPHRVCFSSVEEFIAYRQPVDLVVVSSLTRTHYSIVKKLVLSGYHVLVEKPVCLASSEAEELEKLAADRGTLLYQSTLERYNPLIKFLAKNIAADAIRKIESYRFGQRPRHALDEDAKFDLGIHDVDLWFYLYQRQVPWTVHSGYGVARREILVTLKDGGEILLDLLNKYVLYNGRSLDFSKSSPNNPILEMIFDLSYRGRAMNECWSREIRILEEAGSGTIELR